MNEDQEYNDHKLHINPCKCGNLHPKVMGDDFDADVACDQCGAMTEVSFGTKWAIHNWNAGLIIMPETQENKILELPPFEEFEEWINLAYLHMCSRDIKKLYETLKAKCK